MATETLTAKAWIIDQLDENAAGVADRIFDHPAPVEAAYPLITITHLEGGGDVRGVGPARIMTASRFLVRAIDQTTTWSGLQPIAEAVDALLQGQAGSGAHAGVLACVREQPFELLEVEDGLEYRHLGGIYYIYAQ